MPNYTRPTEFTTGQILGRANLSVLRDNDDYFWGLAHGWRPIPGNRVDTSDVMFDGWHYYDASSVGSDTESRKTLDYYLTMNAGGTSLKFYYDYLGSDQVTILNHTAGTYSSDTRGLYDVSVGGTRATGLYRVYAVVDGIGYIRPPFTVYRGAETYSGLPTIRDGDTSSVTFYNRVRSNDLYFNDCQPVQPAFSGMALSGSSVTCWDGWDYHFGSRLYYRIILPSNWDDGVDSFSLQYDYGGANQQQLLHWTTSAESGEGYVDIDTTSYSYTAGQRYRVAARVNSGRQPDVQYLFIEPQVTDPGPGMRPAEWGYTVMDEFAVNQWVYANQPVSNDTRLSLLQAADQHIMAALCTSAKVGRRDYAVPKPSTVLDFVTYTGDFRLVRRYDTLIYRTTDADLDWGTKSETLEDYGTDSYQTLDMTSLDMAYGQVYKISGATIEFAAEVP